MIANYPKINDEIINMLLMALFEYGVKKAEENYSMVDKY
jgi:hypothetical protein